MLEPRVLQIAVDKVIVFFMSNGTEKVTAGDFVTRMLYSFLPEMKPDNLHIVLLSLGALFLVISLSRSAFMFCASAVSASSTEKAVKKLKDKLFSHIQHLPLEYFSKTPTGELVQRCTGDVERGHKDDSSVLRFILHDGKH
jgi:ATP-binding cassette subfamily B protein